MGRTLSETDFSEFSSAATETSSDESVISNKDKKFKCTYTGCFATFSKNRKLINHIRLHTGERPFACAEPGCNKKYTNSSHLRRHKKVKHDGVVEKILCPFDGCEREIANKWGLKRHIRRCHDRDRVYPYVCKQCSQGFPKKQQLQKHSYIHTGQLPYKCDQCDKRFITVRDCNRHKKVHSSLYPCECKEIFDKWSTFLAHRKQCQRKGLKCPACDKEFANIDNLKKHQQTHISPDEREVFMCPYEDCDRHYIYKKNLDFHVKRFHEKVEIPKIPCHYEGCMKMLSKMQNYKVHIQKCHLQTTGDKIKKPRQTRKDKGTFKKSIRAKLIGLKNYENKNPQHENSEINSAKNVPSTLNADL